MTEPTVSNRRLQVSGTLAAFWALVVLLSLAYVIMRTEIDRRNWREYFETRLDTIDHTAQSHHQE